MTDYHLKRRSDGHLMRGSSGHLVHTCPSLYTCATLPVDGTGKPTRYRTAVITHAIATYHCTWDGSYWTGSLHNTIACLSVHQYEQFSIFISCSQHDGGTWLRASIGDIGSIRLYNINVHDWCGTPACDRDEITVGYSAYAYSSNEVAIANWGSDLTFVWTDPNPRTVNSKWYSVSPCLYNTSSATVDISPTTLVLSGYTP